MVRLISRQRGGLAALKLTKLFRIDDFPAAKDFGKVLIIIIYCYFITTMVHGVSNAKKWGMLSKNSTGNPKPMPRIPLSMPYYLYGEEGYEGLT